jgi:hypothetical protein
MRKIKFLSALFLLLSTGLFAQINDVVAKRSELKANEFSKVFFENQHRKYAMIDMQSFASNVEQQNFHDLLFKSKDLAVISTVNSEGLLVVAFPKSTDEKAALATINKLRENAIESVKGLTGEKLKEVQSSIDKNQSK